MLEAFSFGNDLAVGRKDAGDGHEVKLRDVGHPQGQLEGCQFFGMTPDPFGQECLGGYQECALEEDRGVKLAERLAHRVGDLT